ncbi:MAG: hypothetical protein ACD_87C00062G0003 [uncultured bacterium]|nr:MAG: hypothetical protein ACD_87C00062G0003 [uncultured bacterium]
MSACEYVSRSVTTVKRSLVPGWKDLTVEYHSDPTKATSASTSFIDCSSSDGVYRGLSGTTIAPAFHTAKKAIKLCGQLRNRSTTRSPFLTPQAISAAASALL